MRAAVIATAVAVIAGQAAAEEIAFAGIAPGETSCASALERLDIFDVNQSPIQSLITGGAAARLGRGALGYDFVQGGGIHCDATSQTVASIEFDIPKGKAAEIADALNRRHRQISRRLPNLGPGAARYRSASGQTAARIEYVHVSFVATVTIHTTTFAEQAIAYHQAQAAKRRNAVDGAFD